MITTKKTDFLLPVCFVVYVSSSGTPEVSNTNQDSDFFHVFFVCLSSWLALLISDSASSSDEYSVLVLYHLFVLTSSHLLFSSICFFALQERSGILATYMICGLSNMGAIGVAIGIFTSLAPTRRMEIIKNVPLALLAGNLASFSTACVAGKTDIVANHSTSVCVRVCVRARVCVCVCVSA